MLNNNNNNNNSNNNTFPPDILNYLAQNLTVEKAQEILSDERKIGEIAFAPIDEKRNENSKPEDFEEEFKIRFKQVKEWLENYIETAKKLN